MSRCVFAHGGFKLGGFLWGLAQLALTAVHRGAPTGLSILMSSNMVQLIYVPAWLYAFLLPSFDMQVSYL